MLRFQYIYCQFAAAASGFTCCISYANQADWAVANPMPQDVQLNMQLPTWLAAWFIEVQSSKWT